MTTYEDAYNALMTERYGASWDDSTDMTMRGGHTVQRIVRRNTRGRFVSNDSACCTLQGATHDRTPCLCDCHYVGGDCA